MMVAKTFYEIMKFNPYHDKLGRFSTAGGAAFFTYAPGKSKAHDAAIAREKERMTANSGNGKPAIPDNKWNDRHKDIESGKYKNDTDAKEGFIREKTGLSDTECAEIMEQTDIWTGNSWHKANTEILDKYVENAPACSGEIYRGLGFYSSEKYNKFMQNVDIGSLIQMRRNSSWTTDEETTKEFSGMDSKEVHSVLIKCVKNRTSTPITYLNVNNEREVLAHSKAKWKVLKNETTTTSEGYKKTVLTVEEAEYEK